MSLGLEQRPLPHDLDAERSILGAVLMHGELFSTAKGIVGPEDFYRVAHRLVFEACERLEAQHAPIDLLSVKDALATAGNLDAVGGPAYLASLTDGIPRSTNVDYYARIVKEKAQLRAVIAEAGKAIDAAYNATSLAREIAGATQAGLLKVAQDRLGDGTYSMKQLADRSLDALDRALQHPGQITGIPTGYPELDETLCGLNPTDLIIIGGRPGMGKTAFAMNIVENVALAGRAVRVNSLEMSADQLFTRMLSSRARVNMQRLRAGVLGEREFAKITHALGELESAPITIDDRSALTVGEIRAAATKQAAEDGLDLLVIDYIQLMRAEGRHANRSLEIGSISSSLKALAKDLKIPVIVLSQLSRATETRADHRPTPADLRESGSLEQDADVILFPFRPGQYSDGEGGPSIDTGEAEIIVGKQRNGPIGKVDVAYLGQFARFENVARSTPRIAA